MSKELWDFIEVQRISKSKTDVKVNELVQTVFDSLEDLLNIKLQNYGSLQHLINTKKNSNDSLSYFWDWFDEIGYFNLKQILQVTLPENEEILNSLDYRKMILRLDIDNKQIESYFTSIADTLDVIKEYSLSVPEQAGTRETELEKIFEEYKIMDEDSSKQEWVYSGNPAKEKQDFHYFAS